MENYISTVNIAIKMHPDMYMHSNSFKARNYPTAHNNMKDYYQGVSSLISGFLPCAKSIVTEF